MVLQVALWSSEVPAGEYFRMIKETGFIRTAGFLPYGGGALSDGLAQAIERSVGDVWPRCPALQVNVKDGVATGAVVRKDNEEIELTAHVVISNAGPRRTVGLVGSEYLSSGYLKDVDNIKSAPQIVFYISSDRPLIENSSMPLAMPESRRLFYILSCTNVNPELAPKGKHLLITYSFLTSSLPPYDFNKEVELSLLDLRDNIPDFDKHAQILRINSYYGDWGSAGTWAGYSLPIKTPVERLYLVGDRSAPLGWWCSPAAIKSGRLVAEDITRCFKPA